MRSAWLALLFCLALWTPPYLHGAADNALHGAATYEKRSEAEKMSRSRYRDLEVASLVLIVVGGGAAILWAVRKK
ncbi:MAG: hypothetical protein FIA93_10210 [Deltaproteobacteria bacterium]|nr:hypothetical protein [Deltaproteobacteria bacterium]PWB61945.1 MAG: hypothetical protein C3F14_10935 [Deltaproteobacteria bacterium]